ncbi:S-layer homology domain-containing protein [Paenibacillus sp. JSM ZJ436]|uniref:S-layer homology domain-containing protein n=1 Tax=Paenibacillus sp. JSM ZJ436 TaxID=3376190 RepID=UPI0037903EF5
MKKSTKMISALLMSSALVGSMSASAFAFSDVEDSSQLAIVKDLQRAGVINGISEDRFAPNQSLTAAQAVQMIVNATELQVFPNFSGQSFSSVPDGAWFSEAVNIAAMHGLPVTNEMAWNKPINRETFAGLLHAAVQSTGDYPIIAIHIEVADEEKISEEFRGAVQFLLITNMADLNDKDEFQPKETLTRMEAAQMVHAARDFLNGFPNEKPPVEIPPGEGGDQVSSDVIKVDENVNKVVITKSDMPHPGYGLMVSSIEFVSDWEAVVYYSVTPPDPDKMYPQVISEATAEAYVPAPYKVTVKEAPSSP